MATDISMPSVSPSITEGRLIRWTKKIGDAVAGGDVVAEVETDKAVLEVEAPAAGLLGGLYADAGAMVQVGAAIGVILSPGEPLPAPKALATPKTLATPKAITPPSPKPPGVGGDQAAGRMFSSPLARRIARDRGVSLAGIRGSGPNGRILRRDVERASVPGAGSGGAVVPVRQEHLVPSPLAAAGDYDEIPHSAMRRIIARRLSESKQQIPHFYLTVDCRVDALLNLRQEINRAAPERKISVNDFVIKAVAAGMRSHPQVNAAWTESAIRIYREVDIAVAVATPGGLITPVIRRASVKGIGEISAEAKDLAERARGGKLLPEEYQGGGITISNLGMYGVREFKAIINPPQACILAVGAAEKRPVVDGEALGVATVMTCTLSADHRVVDGAVGAEFLATVKSLIENPLRLLI